MNYLSTAVTISLILLAQPAASQSFIGWKGEATDPAKTITESKAAQDTPSPPPSTPAQYSSKVTSAATHTYLSTPTASNATINLSNRSIECDAEADRTYPRHIWAPGIAQKRQDLHQACMSRTGNASNPQTVASAQSDATNRKTECEGEAARTYPIHIWFPGVGKKREALVAACMSR